jgi:hypothetical protein
MRMFIKAQHELHILFAENNATVINSDVVWSCGQFSKVVDNLWSYASIAATKNTLTLAIPFEKASYKDKACK